jgi:hypothetical protein
MTNKRPAPPELQSLIELVNSVPPDVDLPNPKGKGKKFLKLLRKKQFTGFVEIIGGIQPDTFLTKFLGEGAPKTYNKLLEQYLYLRDGRAWLRRIALIGQLPRRMKYLMPHVSVYTNDRGELIFNIPPLIKILQGVEAARVRRCPICDLIFWAARTDKPCCSTRCAKARRRRHSRKKHRVKYGPEQREQRRQRRIQKEQIERAELEKLSVVAVGGKRKMARLPVSGNKH